MAKHKFINCVMMMAFVLNCRAVVMRNKALINKMVSHFQKESYLSQEHNGQNDIDVTETTQKPEKKVLSIMQNVLCKNFPTIPCKFIVEDDTLKKLIQKSIQQIKYKRMTIEKTTAFPGYLTLFPIVNSEDLSNFVQVRDNRALYSKQKENDEPVVRRKKKTKNTPIHWSQEVTQKKKQIKNKKETNMSPSYTGRKKIRKFYPHKIKYKDKTGNKARKDFGDYSEEKLSMSVELPDMTLTKHHQHLNYKAVPADPPVWRIDYLKHGEPSLNMLGYEDNRLRGKIMKTGPSVIVDENVLEQGARKDVLHPDVYIKKNYVKKNADMNSENNE